MAINTFIKRAVYSLKRRYGVSTDLYVFIESNTNLDTGEKSVIKNKYKINRAILLPPRGSRDFDYDLSFIAANKNFTYGGVFEKRIRDFIFDKRDLPKNYIANRDDYLVVDTKRYNIKLTTELDFAIHIIAEQIEGDNPQQLLEDQFEDSLSITQVIGYEII